MSDLSDGKLPRVSRPDVAGHTLTGSDAAARVAPPTSHLCFTALSYVCVHTHVNLCLSQNGFRCDGGEGNDPRGLFHAAFCAAALNLSTDGAVLMEKQPGKITRQEI